MSFGLHGLDYVALALFIVCWLGADWLIAHHARRKPGVHDLIRPLRMEWMRQAQLRDIRIAEAGLIGHPIHSATFFVATTALILLVHLVAAPVHPGDDLPGPDAGARAGR